MRPASTVAASSDRELLAAAGGDEDAFRHLVEPHRRELQAHCYQMLGSVQDAEDAIQEVLLRAWRALDGLKARVGLRAWLYRIATNVCLDAIDRRRRRVLPADLRPPSDVETDPSAPLVESIWIDPYPDERLGVGEVETAPEARYEQREAVELAFAAALQHLPANQRAVLILREVLGFSASEVSETLDTTVASVNSALQRARRAVSGRLPAQSQQATMRQLGDQRVRRVVERYIEAMERNDTDALVELLAEDVSFAMPPYPEWWRGRATLLDLFQRLATVCPGSRGVPIGANAQPAIAWFAWNPERRDFTPGAIEVLDLEGERVREIIAFAKPELFPRFGLPDVLPR